MHRRQPVCHRSDLRTGNAYEPGWRITTPRRLRKYGSQHTEKWSTTKSRPQQYNPQINMFLTGGWATASPNMGYDVSFTPILGMNVNIPIFRWGARFKANRQQKAYIGIQKLQQSYVTDNINEELSATLTKLTETEPSSNHCTRNHGTGRGEPRPGYFFL